MSYPPQGAYGQPAPQPRKRRGLLIGLAVAVALLACIGGVAAISQNGGGGGNTTGAAGTQGAGQPVAGSTKTQRQTKAATRTISVEEQNAVGSAREYLAAGAFSRKGLIRQLSSAAGDGYSVKAATAAVDSLHIDFNEQAAKSAKTYLQTGSFSRNGLIEQLESDAGEGFTHAQAVYGVTQAGL